MSLLIPEKTLYDLEWDRLIDTLAGYAATTRGRSRCLALPFYDSLAEAQLQQERVEEFRSLLVKGEAPGLGGVDSQAGELAQKAQKQAALSIQELGQVADTIDAANRIAQTMTHRESDCPGLFELCTGLVISTRAKDAIDYAIDRNQNEIRDRASAELGPLRQRLRHLKEKVKTHIESLVDSPEVGPLLRDNYYTLRDDRYVVPVKAHERASFKGIVHGSSATGQTIFVEPRELVPLNNDLILAQMDVEREERRVLRNLSASVAEEAGLVVANLELLVKLDVIQAKARLSELLGANKPILCDEPLIDLLSARHPLLQLKGIEVVPNDLHVGRDFTVLVLSGVNTGGKTVALKVLGLCLLMAWTGLPIPAKPGSRVGRMTSVYAVMGDEQSLSDDLSTFSANILKLNDVLARADARSLVLLDEIVVGTDPKQGAALAQSIVESMADKGARAVVTTHYDRLKRLAYVRPDFANAAVGLSDSSLRPNYQILIGVPGVSSAFRIAAELGVAAEVIARAERLCEGEGDDVSVMIQNLELELAKQNEEVRRLEEAKREAQRAREAYEVRKAALDARERQDILEKRRDIEAVIVKAQDEVRAMIRELQKGANMAQATAAMEQLREMETEAKESLAAEQRAIAESEPRSSGTTGGGARSALSGAELLPGLAVFVANLNQCGYVVEPPDKRGLALVEVGRLKMRIPLERLKALHPGEAPRAEKGGRTRIQEAYLGPKPSAASGPAITCDIRGERVEEALDRVDAFLDRAMGASVPFVYIIHGHGTGRLKQALRDHLKQSPYIRSFRAGERGEGQDGVTVAILEER